MYVFTISYDIYGKPLKNCHTFGAFVAITQSENHENSCNQSKSFITLHQRNKTNSINN